MDQLLLEAGKFGMLALPREPRVISPSCPRLLNLADEDARQLLRFSIPSLQLLLNVLELPDIIRTKEGDVVPSIEALALVCRRLSEPCRWQNIEGSFQRSACSLSRIFNETVAILYKKHDRRIFFNLAIARKKMETYCDAISRKGSPLTTCFGFIDGTKHCISRPSRRKNAPRGENLQRSVLSGHKRIHCFNWQGICSPDGLCISLYGPLEGRKHVSTVLAKSGISGIMREKEMFEGKVIYGDAGYPVTDVICAPFQGASLTPAQEAFNTMMSSCRQSVEWLFNPFV
jgi:hypothetical protein